MRHSARDGDTIPHTYTHRVWFKWPRYCWSGLSYWCLTVHITNGPSDGMADSSGIRRDSSLAHRPHTPFVIIWFWCNYSDSCGGGLTVWISLNVGRGVAMSIPSACSTDRYDGYISLRSHCTSSQLFLLSAFDIPIDLLILPQVVLICPRAPTSQVRGITVHPALLHLAGRERCTWLFFERMHL